MGMISYTHWILLWLGNTKSSTFTYITSPSQIAMLLLTKIVFSLEAAKYRNNRADLAKYREI